ncbi:F0F1 ATP synthase subunit epsilon [Ovoidimarina sediminis]|uniref:F0F1 ATP synthase subunit epsilon n=1 Tax=Ovoidimarina sediminis TaxID=3079856 RepID=UPI00290F9842|nr:F0F1 ATP synthase subunit epsilon [Rhodophyticola sp. MJ-SS7]MDU8945649.1 F0F1 ATP synthase subunit epsilon [Rhodophyticola sp. MJ-SS7]
MADTMQFDLVSPERRLASLEARAVRIPGADGDMTAMPDHAPTITTLRPGLLTVETGSGSESYLVTGGFAEITAEGTTVLAEAAMAKDEVTRDYLESLLAEAREAQASATPDLADAAAKVVADLVAVGDQIGL